MTILQKTFMRGETLYKNAPSALISKRSSYSSRRSFENTKSWLSLFRLPALGDINEIQCGFIFVTGFFPYFSRRMHKCRYLNEYCQMGL
jgi:hypothetical protein